MAKPSLSSMAPNDPNPSKQISLHAVYTVTNIQHKIRILDGTKVTYNSWVKLFQLHARGYKVLDHIDVQRSFPERKRSYNEEVTAKTVNEKQAGRTSDNVAWQCFWRLLAWRIQVSPKELKLE
ncbi:hypothetical protein L6452_13398 [Arctium lappa]|uniref:Uncharacterized protein n=1 Tax=Arctium lappa TaxID=4217 RepID=A0ACB9CI67_ARCLA|nr:hypothetical protein L6452_13398 [Arctium lappa]